jgi:hypothetical protein
MGGLVWQLDLAVDRAKWKFEHEVVSHMFTTSTLKEKMEMKFSSRMLILGKNNRSFESSGFFF